MVRRAIRLEGLDTDLELSKVTSIKTNKKMIHLDQLPDGSWRRIYNASLISDITKLQALTIIRDDKQSMQDSHIR